MSPTIIDLVQHFKVARVQMSNTRRLPTFFVDLAVRILGRRQVVRISRFALNRARLDVQNTIQSNGESQLQLDVLQGVLSGKQITIFDVGANVGQWSQQLVASADSLGVTKRMQVHAFEPSTFSSDRLRKALEGKPVLINKMALSDTPGEAKLHIIHEGAGSNSLHKSSHLVPSEIEESVLISTLDEYCKAMGIESIDLLKIDTEGHDHLVMKGATALLGQRKIAAVQFEYNHRWIAARHYLRDAFDLLSPLGYQLGKITPVGIEAYPDGWDPDLETFVEGNYLAWDPAQLVGIKIVPWWKTSKR